MCFHNERFAVISGGPGAGKTTVLRELSKLGFAHAPEVARQIIQEQTRSGGMAVPWGDTETYTRLMLQRSIDSYLKNFQAHQWMFFDRAIPDTLAYARLIALPEQGFIQTACRRYRYAQQVFLAPPWKEIYETDSERRQDFSEAQRTFEQLAAVYKEYDYQIIELPKATPAARAQYILEQLGASIPCA